MSFKDLHDEWKKAKKDAKSIYDHWARLFTDVSNAQFEVKVSVPAFPKFDKDLGPNLEDLHKDKNVDKALKKATDAVDAYLKDVKKLADSVDDKAKVLKKAEAVEGQKPKIGPYEINDGFGKFVEIMRKTLKKIEGELEERLEEHKKASKKK